MNTAYNVGLLVRSALGTYIVPRLYILSNPFACVRATRPLNIGITSKRVRYYAINSTTYIIQYTKIEGENSKLKIFIKSDYSETVIFSFFNTSKCSGKNA